MIIERKQYGPVSVLFVQIGLALYVIVVFLAQGPNGTVSPKILKVQKVGMAQSAQTIRLGAGANSVAGAIGGVNSVADSASQILDSQILALIAPQPTTLTQPEVIASVTPQNDFEEPNSTDIFNIGSKPRAPTFA